MDIRIKESRKNIPIGWVLCESSMEEDALTKPKLLNTDDRRVIGEARFQRGNKKNRNGRWYDTKDLASQIVCPRSLELLKTGWGSENGHPMSKDLIRQQTIDPNNVVAFILKLWMDGDFVMGNFKGSNLPIGEAFDQDLRDGMLPAWSLRALGTVENTNRGAEVKGVKIITYDRVYYPSYDNAYTERIVSESTDYKTPSYPYEEYLNSMGNKQVIEESADSIAPILNKDVTDLLLRESYSFNQICEDFSPIYKSIKLSDDKKKVVMVDESYNTIIVPIDRYVTNKIDEFCSRL